MTTLFLSACIGSGSVSDVNDPQQQNTFPTLRGIDLTGEEQIIPSKLDGDKKLLLIAFQREQQQQIDTWLNVVKDIEAANNNFRYYEVPVIYEGSAPFRFWVNNGMRSGIQDQTARERTITVYTDRDKFFDIMEMNEDSIYAVLVDQNDQIVWRSSGVSTDEKINELQTFLTQ